MQRRKFLASSLAASALAVTQSGSYLGAAEGDAQKGGREFYQLRRYHIISGPQRKLCDDFFSGVMIPDPGTEPPGRRPRRRLRSDDWAGYAHDLRPDARR